MHFDGAQAGHQAKLSGTTKGRPKIEAGKFPGPSWSALQASSQGRNRATLTMVTKKRKHVSPPFRTFECGDWLHQERSGRQVAFAGKPWFCVRIAQSPLVRWSSIKMGCSPTRRSDAKRISSRLPLVAEMSGRTEGARRISRWHLRGSVSADRVASWLSVGIIRTCHTSRTGPCLRRSTTATPQSA